MTRLKAQFYFCFFKDINNQQGASKWALREHQPLFLSPAWCLRNEGVSSVLLGTSNPEQLTENLGAIQVGTCRNTLWFGSTSRPPVDPPPFLAQVLPKMTSQVVSEIDHILGNRPYSKKDYRS